jgi:uncharacterized MnhB-related membrane protein
VSAGLNLSALAFDGLLCIMLLLIAGLVIASPGLFRSILLFFVFGLLMSLAWVRLNAVDVALAEAAIGAGLTGAIFLAAYSRVRRISAPEGDQPSPEPAEPKGD